MKHPGFGLIGLRKSIDSKGFHCRFKKLLDFLAREFPVEPRLSFRSVKPLLAAFGFLNRQLNMPVIQWLEHLAENIKKLIITGFTCDFGPERFVLLIPVDIAQAKKRIPVVKSVPQVFKILFGIAIDHDSDEFSTTIPFSIKWNYCNKKSVNYMDEVMDF